MFFLENKSTWLCVNVLGRLLCFLLVLFWLTLDLRRCPDIVPLQYHTVYGHAFCGLCVMGYAASRHARCLIPGLIKNLVSHIWTQSMQMWGFCLFKGCNKCLLDSMVSSVQLALNWEDWRKESSSQQQDSSPTGKSKTRGTAFCHQIVKRSIHHLCETKQYIVTTEQLTGCR